MSVEHVDCIVVGAGVVGLAVARALSRAGRDVLVLEQADRIGTETSSRNSEIIHSGVYYEPGSLMARLCVLGRRALYDYCETHGVPVERCGKLIVATQADEDDKLDAIFARGRENGVEGLRLLSPGEAKALEPRLACTAALLSETTGLVDTHALMLALRGDAETAGAAFAFHAPVERATAQSDRVEVYVGGPDAMSLSCKLLVNCAGLHAPALASRIEGFPADRVPKAYFAKGSYFTLKGRTPFRHLIYPVPTPGGLGIHLTFDLGHSVRFGPDVEWVDAVDYAVDAGRAASFYAAIRTYWPELPDGSLAPGYSGIRPKIVPPGAPSQDFLIQGPRDHGVEGVVNLFGIESPGLTASLAIADHVLTLV